MIFKKVLLWIMLFVFVLQGCNTTVSKERLSDMSIKASNIENDENLDTLSGDNGDYKEQLQKTVWSKIKADISIFYDNDNYPSLKSYKINIKFKKREVTAYADCQKITANYRVKDDELTFSNISVAPAIELATCVESHYADDTVLAFFENSFILKKVNQSKAEFIALDFDTSIELFK